MDDPVEVSVEPVELVEDPVDDDPVEVSVELLVELVGETKERIWCEFMLECFFLVKDTHHLKKILLMSQL